MKKLSIIKGIFFPVLIILSFFSQKSYSQPNYADSLRNVEDVIRYMSYNSVIDQYKDFKGKGFTVTRYKYFVIFSELSDDITYKFVNRDLRNLTEGLANTLLKTKPYSPVAVFMFRDSYSYQEAAVRVGQENSLAYGSYGFYNPAANIVMGVYSPYMNIISHEVVHSLLAQDFDNLPLWLNEGLASFYEKFDYKSGTITGLNDYRLYTLKDAMRSGSYTPLREMMETHSNEYYLREGDYYYAQAKYLLMYLQNKGLAEEYYKEVRDNYILDPTGIKQLEKVTGLQLAVIEKDYTEYIKSLQTKW